MYLSIYFNLCESLVCFTLIHDTTSYSAIKKENSILLMFIMSKDKGCCYFPQFQCMVKNASRHNMLNFWRKNGKRSTFFRVLPSTFGKYTTIYHKVETPLPKKRPGVPSSTGLSCRFTKIYSGNTDKVYQALLKVELLLRSFLYSGTTDKVYQASLKVELPVPTFLVFY